MLYTLLSRHCYQSWCIQAETHSFLQQSLCPAYYTIYKIFHSYLNSTKKNYYSATLSQLSYNYAAITFSSYKLQTNHARNKNNYLSRCIPIQQLCIVVQSLFHLVSCIFTSAIHYFYYSKHTGIACGQWSILPEKLVP